MPPSLMEREAARSMADLPQRLTLILPDRSMVALRAAIGELARQGAQSPDGLDCAAEGIAATLLDRDLAWTRQRLGEGKSLVGLRAQIGGLALAVAAESAVPGDCATTLTLVRRHVRTA